MKNKITYRNKNGIEFSIEIEKGRIPVGCEYWGFIYRARETQSGLSKNFKVIIYKNYIAEEYLAEEFIKSDPLTYLKSYYLDQYANGEHPIIWPDSFSKWIVI